MGRIFNCLVRLLILKGIKDTQCGFKCFKNKVARRVFENTRIARFSFDVEVLYITKKFGYKIKEVPVNWYDSGRSSVNLISDSLKMLKDIIKLRLQNPF